MMTDISTPRFLLGSQQVFGNVESSLVDLAKQLLTQAASRSRDESSGGELSAFEFAKQAENEFEYYR